MYYCEGGVKIIFYQAKNICGGGIISYKIAIH